MGEIIINFNLAFTLNKIFLKKNINNFNSNNFCWDILTQCMKLEKCEEIIFSIIFYNFFLSHIFVQPKLSRQK